LNKKKYLHAVVITKIGSK